MMVLGVMQQNAGTTAEKTALQNQINELKLRSAQDDRASARVITEDTMATLQSLKDHPGFDSSIGFYELRKGLTPESRAFNAKLTQAINSLALPNLGALKGPMSDKDILFIKNISSRLQETRVDPEDYKAAIDEAVKFLKRKLEITADTPPGSDASDPLGLRKK
jgi:hypothetical protein